MFCRICGKQIPGDSAFCTNCGASQIPTTPQQAPPAPPFAPYPAPQSDSERTPEPLQQSSAPPREKAGKRNAPALIFAVISVLLAAALVLSFLGILPSPFGTSAASAAAFASQSFSTPEEAIESFVGYLKAGDYDGALGTCAVGNMASGFDYQYTAKRLMTLLPVATSNMPSEYPQYVLYNRHKAARELLMQMICFSVSFHISDESRGLIDGMPVTLENGEFPDGLIEQLDPLAISSLEIVDIAKTSMHDDELNRENQKKQAKVYGADDVQFRSVLYELDGGYYVGGFTVIEFNGRWQIQNMSDPIVGISAFGTPIPVSDKSEFENLLGY